MTTESEFKLQGALTVEQVPEAYARSLSWKTGAIPSSIHLGELEQTDSSAVALLLEWQSWARARNEVIEFLNPPETLRTIAGLSQVDRLLGWSNDK